MSELPLNNAKVKTGVRKPTRPRVPEPMNVHPLHNTRLLRVTLKHFPNIGVGQSVPGMGSEHETTVSTPDRKPLVDLPDGSVVNADHPTLSSFTLEYSDGSSITVDVANSEVKSLVAPKLTTKVDGDEGTVPRSSRRWWKRLEDLAKRFVPEDFRCEC